MASAPSSSFTAVLRRSRFASYDPAIAQVYTTYGGDAHRGNWGLKRPLPLRRRGAAITVSAVDSQHQQTEWKTGDPQSRWVKMFGELGREPTPARKGGDWYNHIGQAAYVWEVDSEYARLEDGAETVAKERAEAKLAQASNNVPNVNAMTDSQFAAYERKLRGSQQRFKNFLETNAKLNPNASGARSPHSPHAENAIRMFLQQEAAKEYASSTRLIEQKPHPGAGLSYAHVPPMQAYFASRALPGRILGNAQADNQSRFRSGYVAGFAGMRTTLETKNSEGLRPARAGQTPTETLFRVDNAEILRAPRVVGRSQTALDGTDVSVSVQSWREPDALRANPHTPGTREWVGHQAALHRATHGRLRPKKPVFFGGQVSPRMDPPSPPRPVSHEDIVNSLRALISNKK